MDDGARDGAADVLHDVLAWRLTEARWLTVGQAIGALASALAAGDEPAFRHAVYDLELAGPVRAVSAGSPPREPAPDMVRERINELIHTLGGSQPPDGQDPDDDAVRASG